MIAAVASAADKTPSEPLVDFPPNRVWIIVAIILLMALLFWIPFYWQKYIEQAGYFGRIYQDTIESIEMTRLSAPIREKWDQGVYLDEVFRRRSKRGEDWVAKNPQPKPADFEGLSGLASELQLNYELYEIQRSMEIPRFGTSQGDPFGARWGEANRRPRGTGGLGSSSGSGFATPPGIDQAPVDPEKERKKERFWQLRYQFCRAAEAWADRAVTCASGWYQEDLDDVKTTAQEQAKQALKVDFSALRGRGPEFVLEFTAVVVIIFAAVILGVVDRLSSEQMGTLLAAIAGYVLGKAATRSRSGPSEDQATVRPSQVQTSIKAPKPGIEGDTPAAGT